MKATSIIALGAYATGVLGQAGGAVFEQSDFNVTEALLDIGFNVSAIPELADLVERSSLTACSIACTALNVVYGNANVLSENSAPYNAFTDAYWSAQQAEVNPRCVFKPSKALDVSALVLVSRLTQCPFAVKSGGHTAFAQGSSIEGGITVSLEKMKAITVSSDKKVASIGPGNVWLDVYQTLEKSGLAVVGGRMSTIGVSGLLLGGGISYFANKLGWACDNVVSYEVVTASGIIVTASPTQYSDLYWALRGGGNNFGVVTKFNLNAFPIGKMWGGSRLFSPENFSKALDAIYNFAYKSSSDLEAAQILYRSFGYMEPIGKLMAAQLQYTNPSGANASIFDEFQAIPALQDTSDVFTLSQLVENLGADAPKGTLRQTYWDVSFKLNRALLKFVTDKYYELLPTILDVEGVLATAAIQPITPGQLTGMQKNGGNALGLEPAGGPYFILNLANMWAKAEDEARMVKFSADLINASKAEAKRIGADNDYIYMNYASQYQDPIGSYGPANVQRLRSIAKKYDPSAVFQTLVPGYFKLYGGAPNPNMP